MDRVIKFRAWDGKRMLYRTLYDRNWYTDDDKCVRRAMPRDSNILKVMQSTGLRDLKRTEEYPDGQLIYEEDIVLSDYKGVLIDQKEVILWCEEHQQYYRYMRADGTGGPFSWDGAQAEISEVIGNIHQHPKLLEENQ